jgi:hypothetical protein
MRVTRTSKHRLTEYRQSGRAGRTIVDVGHADVGGTARNAGHADRVVGHCGLAAVGRGRAGRALTERITRRARRLFDCKAPALDGRSRRDPRDRAHAIRGCAARRADAGPRWLRNRAADREAAERTERSDRLITVRLARSSLAREWGPRRAAKRRPTRCSTSFSTALRQLTRGPRACRSTSPKTLRDTASRHTVRPVLTARCRSRYASFA